MSIQAVLRRHRAKLVPLLVAVLAGVATAVYWDALSAWFTGEPVGETHSADADAESSVEGGDDAPEAAEEEEERGPELPPLEARELPPPALGKLQTALVAYEEIRNLLAADAVEGIAPHAGALAATLRETAEELEGAVAESIEDAAVVAAALEGEDDIEVARVRFGDLSKYFVALGAMDPRLTEGWFVFECPMSEGYRKWVQRSHELENPYMGTRMLTCGSRSDWAVGAAAAAEHDDAKSGDEIAHYTCSMHPSVRQEQPGTCPICAMDLTPVTREEIESGIILVDDERRRRIGVKLTPVERRPMVLPIRAVGTVAYDESQLHDVNLRMSGWVERLVADETGQRVRRGQVLFTLYSPELFAAQLEYLNALRGRETAGRSPALEGTSEALIRASRQRLELLGMPEQQIAQLERRGEAWRNVPVLSPASGYIIAKDVVQGAQIEAGSQVYRIANLDEVWVEAQVYESDLPHVREGQEVEVTLPYLPDRTYEGTVDYVYPSLDPATRTGRVRVVLANPELELRPEMYANVVLRAELGEQLLIPESAVLYTGPRRIVFVDLGGGRLRPQEVELGARTGDHYAVLDGLEAGDVVVSSGNFLIASESRLKSATDIWSGGEADGTD